MANALRRPSASCTPAKGLLCAEQFQVAYATNDIDRARDWLSERLGIAEFRSLEGATPAGGHIRVELAWVGPTMYELITATGPGSELYVGRLGTHEFAIRHHHLGFMIADEAQWHAVHAEAKRQGFAVPYENETPGFMRSCFVDVPELGHYLEYLWPTDAGREFFASVPAN
ncbi:hypothetical protein GCM10011494_38560 [Novosphingobium endophyticum]|uniref:Glyoxalase/fosfomycin resistance/dioxygenase domain-containing protein n=1 Tax=Novosphingobium endophyticum TaxID=1955250 RepID=A0A916TVM0_9SPHN|nr:VOC family protein [Novosphingobium endophyticum]GGC15949.1 hypothetical protein GCM10011494_38560 [Novosphingobium endophyticum]